MSDFARLEEKLGKLRQAAPRDKRGRVLAGADAETRLAAAMTEFDETILPRRIEFTLNEAAIAFAVANRKLHCVLAPAATIGKADFSDLQGRALSGKDDPALDDLRDALLAALDASGDWRILSKRLSREEAAQVHASAGVRAASLMSLWRVNAGTTAGTGDTGTIVQRFVQALNGVATAWLVIEGEEVAATGGDADVIDWISERAGGFLDGYYSRSELFSVERPHALAFSGGAGRSVFYFSAGEQAGFVSLPPARLFEAFGIWQRAVSG